MCREQKHGVYNIRELVNSHDFPPVPWGRPGGPGAAFSAVFWPRAPLLALPHQRKTPLGGSDQWFSYTTPRKSGSSPSAATRTSTNGPAESSRARTSWRPAATSGTGSAMATA